MRGMYKLTGERNFLPYDRPNHIILPIQCDTKNTNEILLYAYFHATLKAQFQLVFY